MYEEIISSKNKIPLGPLMIPVIFYSLLRSLISGKKLINWDDLSKAYWSVLLRIFRPHYVIGVDLSPMLGGLVSNQTKMLEIQHGVFGEEVGQYLRRIWKGNLDVLVFLTG